MTAYVCIEEQELIGVMEEKPNTPESVTIIEISEEDYKSLKDETAIFDIGTLSVVPTKKKNNNYHRAFLNDTDWMILRHLREQRLGLTTSLTEEELLNLEKQRQEAAENIKDDLEQ